MNVNGTVFRDFTMLMVLGFVAMVVWMLPHLNPPAKNDDTLPPGNVIATITWPEGDTDVDMWVTGPYEAWPVGFSNRGGLLWNLLRDDLGNTPDATKLNYENAYTRGMPPGEYQVNVHCWRCPVLPVPVDIEVAIKPEINGKAAMRVLATTRLELNRNGEELTALRFALQKDGSLVADSLSHYFTPLFAARNHK